PIDETGSRSTRGRARCASSCRERSAPHVGSGRLSLSRWGEADRFVTVARGISLYLSINTSVALMTALTVSPALRPNGSAEPRVIAATSSTSPTLIVTSAMTLPSLTDLIVAGIWLRALSMANSFRDETEYLGKGSERDNSRLQRPRTRGETRF